MALPIMATPTLEGEDALRFYRELEVNRGKRVPREEVRRGVEIYNAVMKRNPNYMRAPEKNVSF
jgi:hypothetical protein